MEGTKQKSPYQHRVFRPKPSLLRGKLRPSPSFGNLNWLRTNHKGRICFRFFLIVISSLGVPSQSLSLCGVLLLPSADCDSIRAARRFVSNSFFPTSRSTPPEILQLLDGPQVIKENWRNRATSAPPTSSSNAAENPPSVLPHAIRDTIVRTEAEELEFYGKSNPRFA
jgi:hypothetical protein